MAKTKQLVTEPLSSGTDVETRVKTRELVGINNRMPSVGENAKSGYVILGRHDAWTSPPTLLTMASKDHAVAKETYNYMVRDLSLSDGVEAAVVCEDGSSVACTIKVQTVC